ncbi:MAG TPA: hypothetical protein VGB37_15315 [Candidatus Lokiarchaeia archaeon]
MLQEVPIIKERTEVIYDDITSKKAIEKFGQHEPPVIFINSSIYSEGHVPIIKNLSKTLIDLMKT